MKHFLIKFNYAVEIGAYIAYLGHYRRTKDKNILRIAKEENMHRNQLNNILITYKEKPLAILNILFLFIGGFVYLAYQISPRCMLNPIARAMEIFAVFSYNRLARQYPKWEVTFRAMARNEKEHEIYLEDSIS